MTSEDLSSEFEFNAHEVEKKRRRLDLATSSDQKQPIGNKSESQAEWNKEDRKQKFLGIDPYSRHKILINEYLLNYPGATRNLQRDTSRDRTDADVIRANHKFLWPTDADDLDWGAKLAKRYYDKLFKEYCISDLSRFKENKIALRWRTEQEVVSGKGQFICANKKCIDKNELVSWEVNFGYVEGEEKKNALIKLRLCPDCSQKLNYRYQRKRHTKSGNHKAQYPRRRTESIHQILACRMTDKILLKSTNPAI